jgi:hypothetical protein
MSRETDALAERIRAEIGDDPNISEKRMFGGFAFMLNGNMLVGPLKGGGLLVRVGKEGYAAALKRKGAGPMKFTGREMAGFVEVSEEGIATTKALREWIAIATKFVSTLDPK